MKVLLALVLALLGAPVAQARMPAVPVVIHENTPCPYYAQPVACSYQDSDDIYLPAGSTRSDREHEIGHQFDRQVLTDENRAWFTRQLGFAPGSWDRGTGDDCGNCGPSEVFADAYAKCATGWKVARRNRQGMLIGRQEVAYGYFPTVKQHRRICNGIAVIGLVHDYQSALPPQSTR
jgi:hypothetical protein